MVYIGFSRSGITFADEWIVEIWIDPAHTNCPNTSLSRTGFFVTLLLIKLQVPIVSSGRRRSVTTFFHRN